eukprot:184169_1
MIQTQIDQNRFVSAPSMVNGMVRSNSILRSAWEMTYAKRISHGQKKTLIYSIITQSNEYMLSVKITTVAGVGDAIGSSNYPLRGGKGSVWESGMIYGINDVIPKAVRGKNYTQLMHA